MSIALMSAAFRAPVSPTQKLVLLALCDCANDQGECYPSIHLMEEKTSLSDRSVQRAMSELEVGGFLRRVLRPGRATVYWMSPAAGAPLQEMRASPTPDTASPPTQRHPDRLSPTPDTASPPPPTGCHHTPDRLSPRIIKEPSVESSLKRKKAESAQTPTPPPFAGDSNLEVLNGRQVVPLAAHWKLPRSWASDAEALGWPAAEVRREAEKFRQYWVSGKGCGTRRSVKGWRQAFSNWLGNAEKFAGMAGRAQPAGADSDLAALFEMGSR